MTELPSRELRNNVSAVLRRVEQGERIRVTVSGRPVAELVPLAQKPMTMRWEVFTAAIAEKAADAGLAQEFRETLKDTTDDIEV